MNADLIETVARAMCAEQGQDADKIMANDGPLWGYYVPSATAALSEIDLPAIRAAAEAKGELKMGRVERRERQSTKYWMRAAEAALAGDMRALRNRVDMHKAAPVDVVLSSLRALPVEAGE